MSELTPEQRSLVEAIARTGAIQRRGTTAKVNDTDRHVAAAVYRVCVKPALEAAEARATTAEQERRQFAASERFLVSEGNLQATELSEVMADRDALQAQKDAALAVLNDWPGGLTLGQRMVAIEIRAALTDPPKEPRQETLRRLRAGSIQRQPYRADPPKAEPGACPAVLTLLGGHFPCEWGSEWGNTGPHPGWGHANKAAQAVWCGDEGPVRPKAEPSQMQKDLETAIATVESSPGFRPALYVQPPPKAEPETTEVPTFGPASALHEFSKSLRGRKSKDGPEPGEQP